MTFDWSEYLNVARELTGVTTTPSSQEAKQRSAISHSYYAAFIQARNFLRDHDGLTIPRENAHQYIINQFKNSSNVARSELGQKLQRSRGDRNRADYNDTFPRLMRKSREALNLASFIISQLAKL